MQHRLLPPTELASEPASDRRWPSTAERQILPGAHILVSMCRNRCSQKTRQIDTKGDHRWKNGVVRARSNVPKPKLTFSNIRSSFSHQLHSIAAVLFIVSVIIFAFGPQYQRRLSSLFLYANFSFVRGRLETP